LPSVKGLVHITGGGFPGNVPRILPEGTAAHFNTAAWEVPPLFRLIQSRGDISREEMSRVFNMGLGMVIIATSDNARRIKERLDEVVTVGEIVSQQGHERVILD
jgi:phosphoribosylformylglycinamidine cyclo-ligase